MSRQEEQDARDTLFMLGGVAMMIFGAGLILSNPIVRRFYRRRAWAG